MSSEKPTFVIVPGSFHVDAHMQPLVKVLAARGYAGFVIQSSEIGVVGKTEILPKPEKPIRDKIEDLVVREEKDVVLVCCSAGGSRGSMAIKGFEKSLRAKNQEKGGIINVVFVAAILVPDGETIISTIGGGLPAWLEIDKEVRSQYLERCLEADQAYSETCSYHRSNVVQSFTVIWTSRPKITGRPNSNPCPFVTILCRSRMLAGTLTSPRHISERRRIKPTLFQRKTECLKGFGRVTKKIGLSLRWIVATLPF